MLADLEARASFVDATLLRESVVPLAIQTQPEPSAEPAADASDTLAVPTVALPSGEGVLGVLAELTDANVGRVRRRPLRGSASSTPSARWLGCSKRKGLGTVCDTVIRKWLVLSTNSQVKVNERRL